MTRQESQAGQAEALRRRLDDELAAVQATALARERLLRATAARARAGHPHLRAARRLRPVLALPLAGVLVAGVVAAAVVIPSLLRAGDHQGVPAGGSPAPGMPVPLTTSPPAPTADDRPVGPEKTPPARATSRTPKPVPTLSAPTRSSLRVTADPASPEVGRHVTVTVHGVAARHGGVTVEWGDRSADTTVPGNCSRDARAAALAPVAHSYARAGNYRVKVIVDGCGSRDLAELTLTVGQPATPAPSR